MRRPARVIVSHVLWALPGLLFLLGLAPDVQADPVTDTFPLKATGKEWCRDNPRFFETFHVKAKDGITLTITRDPLNTDDLTNLQAMIDTQGGAPDIDAMTLNGLAFPSNTADRTAQIILLGTLNGHFLSVRGQAKFDNPIHLLGNLTKVTGTFLYQFTGTYTIDKQGTESGPVDCFASGTLVTGKKP